MKGSLDGVSKKMDKLVEFLEKRTPEEQKASDMVERHGGEAIAAEVCQRSWRLAVYAYSFSAPS